MTAEQRAAHCRRIASSGGKATASKPGHMSQIGKRGFRALAERLGDNGAAVSYLQAFRNLPRKPRAEWSHNAAWNELEY